jgi:hypothetical protein
MQQLALWSTACAAVAGAASIMLWLLQHLLSAESICADSSRSVEPQLLAPEGGGGQ